MVHENIVKEYTSRNTKWNLLERARLDCENPFGVVLIHIRDCYGLTKTEGWDTAMAICEYYGLT